MHGRSVAWEECVHGRSVASGVPCMYVRSSHARTYMAHLMRNAYVSAHDQGWHDLSMTRWGEALSLFQAPHRTWLIATPQRLRTWLIATPQHFIAKSILATPSQQAVRCL